MKTIKLILLLLFGLIVSLDLSAQTNSADPHIICFGSIQPYRVDYTENSGAGTSGSTYVWTILTPGFTGTISTNQGAGILTNNTISINWGTTPAGDYVLQVVETNVGCPGTPILLTVRVTPLITPTFTQIGPLCQNSVAPILPANSTNSPAITGTWNAAINTSTFGTIVYTFTPDVGQCATTATMSVTISPEITPIFTFANTICSGASVPALPAVSDNGIGGTWLPTTINNTTGATYVFTPTAGQCATPLSVPVVVTPNVTPTFSFATTFCSGTTAPTLPAVSIDGIGGTWLPATINNTTGATYVFTPTAGQCATPLSVLVTVTPNITPAFSFATTFCSGTTAPTLPAVSDNGINGTWLPTTINNTTGGTYVFTPTAGQCATPFSVPVTVTPNATPAFSFAITFCSGATAPTLPAVSDNGINGTWLPTTINNTTGGTYVFTPTAGQCATPLSVPVTVTPNVTPLFSFATTFCSGTTAPTLPAVSNNGISGTWLPTTINNTTGGTYVFTPTAGQCATPLSVPITVTPLPTISVSTAATCAPDLLSYSVTVTVSGGIVTSTAGIVTNPSGNNWTIAGVPVATDIILTVTSTCINTLSITAPNCSCPVIAAPTSPVSTAYCIGSSITTVSATVPAGFTVDWYDAAVGGNLLQAGTTGGVNTYAPAAPGTFYAVTREISTGCLSSTRTPATVTQNPLPNIQAFADIAICAGETTVLSATGGVNYTWSPTTGLSPITGTPVNATPISTQIYTVTGTDGNTCSNTATVTVTVNPLPTTSPIFHD